MCSAAASRSSLWTLSASTPTARSPRAPAPSTVASTGASPPKRPKSSWRNRASAVNPDCGDLARPLVIRGGVDRVDGVGLLDGVAGWQERPCSCADRYAEALDLQLVLVHPLEVALDGLVVALDPHHCFVPPWCERARNEQTAKVAHHLGEGVARS